MKSIFQVKNNIIIVLCFTIICMSIGFIILSTNKTNEEYSYNVVISDVSKTSSIKGSDKTPVATYKILNNTEVDMHYNMYYPNDEISYTVHIENRGTIPCEIVDVLESPDYNNPNFKSIIAPVSITLSDIKGKIIPPDDSIDLKIVVYYNSNSTDKTPKSFDYKIGLITRSR